MYILAALAGLVSANESFILTRDLLFGFTVVFMLFSLPVPVFLSAWMVFCAIPRELLNKSLRSLPCTKVSLGSTYWLIGVVSVPATYGLSYVAGTAYRFWIAFLGLDKLKGEPSLYSPFEFVPPPENLWQTCLTIVLLSGLLSSIGLWVWCHVWIAKRLGNLFALLIALPGFLRAWVAGFTIVTDTSLEPESLPLLPFTALIAFCLLCIYASARLSGQAVDTVASALAREGKKKRRSIPQLQSKPKNPLAPTLVVTSSEVEPRFTLPLIGPPRLPGLFFRSSMTSLVVALAQLLLISAIVFFGPYFGADVELNVQLFMICALIFLPLFFGGFALMPILFLRTLRTLPVSKNVLTFTLAFNVIAIYLPWALATAPLLLLMGAKAWLPLFYSFAAIALGVTFIAHALFAASKHGFLIAAALWLCFMWAVIGVQIGITTETFEEGHKILASDGYLVLSPIERRPWKAGPLPDSPTLHSSYGQLFLLKNALPLSLFLTIAGIATLRYLIENSTNAYRSPPKAFTNPRGFQ